MKLLVVSTIAVAILGLSTGCELLSSKDESSKDKAEQVLEKTLKDDSTQVSEESAPEADTTAKQEPAAATKQDSEATSAKTDEPKPQ